MDIKKIVIIVAVLLLAFIGFNYYSSAQSERARAERMAETEAMRAKNAQAVAPQPATVEAASNNRPSARISEPMPVASDTETFSASIPEEVEPKNNADNSVCDSLIEMSENIMRNRLNGVSIAKSLEAVNSIKDGTPANDAVSNLAKQIVIEAYERPSFSTEKYKDDAIREFGARQYLACIKAVG